MSGPEDHPNRGRRRALTFLGAGGAALIPGIGGLLAARRTDTGQVGGAAPQGGAGTSRLTVLNPAPQRSVMERSLSRAGAVGDGKTIDTAAIQEAVAEVERNTRFETYASSTPFLGPGELIWPQGVFLVDDAIRITRSLRLRGEGQAEYSSGARIQQQQPGKDLFRIEPIAQGCSVGFSNLVLRAIGGGGTGGALLRVMRTAGSCNSIRIVEMVFGTPQSYAIDIEHGDDILIDRCLFDASGTNAIRIGGTAPEVRVSNLRIVDSYFFAVAGICVTLHQAENVVIQGNHADTQTDTRTFLYSPGPPVPGGTQRARNVVVRGNVLRNIDCLADVAAIDGLVLEANIGEGLGAGVAPRRAVVSCAGACSGIVMTGNRLSGEATVGFYDDRTGTVTQAVISSNSLTGSAMRNVPFSAGHTQGRIGDNAVKGATTNGIGYRWTTTGKALSPGLVGAGDVTVLPFVVTGSQPGDDVSANVLATALPDGIVMTAQAVEGAIRIRYANIASRPIRVPAHDVAVFVTR